MGADQEFVSQETGESDFIQEQLCHERCSGYFVFKKSLLYLLQVLLKESSSRKWLLFEYNDWTEPNEWFTIQGIQVYKLTYPT